MSKRDRERVEAGELHRSGKKVKVDPCPFPNCPNLKHPDSPYNACAKHSDLIDDVLFIIEHTRLPGRVTTPAQDAKRAASGLTLPGDPGFDRNIGRR